MSLPEAVLEIADEMEKDANDGMQLLELMGSVKVYAKMLRMAVKAAGGDQPPARNPLLDTLPEDKLAKLHMKKAEQAMEQRALRQEGGARMVTIEGGDSDGAMVPVPGDMPVGAKTFVGSTVHELGKDGKLRPVSVQPEGTP